MTSIESYLERRAHASNSERVLFSEDGLSLAGTAGLSLSHYNAHTEYEKFKSFKFKEIESYQEWKKDFSDKFKYKMDEFDERRIQDFKEFENLLEESEGGTTKELIEFSRKLGNDDNRQRWLFEKFFIEEGNKGAKRVLGINSYEDGETVFSTYTQDQIDQLKETGKALVEGKSPEVHHINSKALLYEDPEMFFDIHHVNNGRIMTGREQTDNAHFSDPNLGHGGSYKNLTRGEAKEVDDRKLKIVEENKKDIDEKISSHKELTDESISSFNLQTGIGVGLVVGVISTIIETKKLKNDPRSVSD